MKSRTVQPEGKKLSIHTDLQLRMGSIETTGETLSNVAYITQQMINIHSDPTKNPGKYPIREEHELKTYDYNIGKIVKAFADKKTNDMFRPCVWLACRYPNANDSMDKRPSQSLRLMADALKTAIEPTPTALPDNFTALLPVLDIAPELQQQIWDRTSNKPIDVELLFEKGKLNLDDWGNHPILWRNYYLGSAEKQVKKALAAITNEVFQERLADLSPQQLAKLLIMQYLGTETEPDSMFVHNAVLGVSPQKEAQKKLKDQILNITVSDKTLDAIAEKFSTNYPNPLQMIKTSGLSSDSSKIAELTLQMKLSIDAVHADLKKQAAALAKIKDDQKSIKAEQEKDKAQQAEAATQQREFDQAHKNARDVLNQAIQACLPNEIQTKDKTLKPDWSRVVLDDDTYGDILEIISELQLSEQKKMVHDHIEQSPLISAVEMVLYDVSPRLEHDKPFNTATHEEQKNYIKTIFKISENMNNIMDAAKACAQLPKTVEEYVSIQRMAHQVDR